MRLKLGLLLFVLVSGCATIPPFDVAGVRIILLCVINCPVSVNIADEGQLTDTLPLEYPHISPESLQAVN